MKRIHKFIVLSFLHYLQSIHLLINEYHPLNQLDWMNLQNQAILAQLRLKDNAKEFTSFSGYLTLPQVIFHVPVHILETFDTIDISKQSKCQALSLYFGYVHQIDMEHMEQEKLAKIGYSVFYKVLSTTENPQILTNFLNVAELQYLKQYFETQEHMMTLFSISEWIGNDGNFTTPYDYSCLAFIQVQNLNVFKAVNAVIDYALTIPEEAQLSAEQIFVGCCLYIVEHSANHPLMNWIQNYSTNAFTNGIILKNLLKNAIHSLEMQ